MNTIILLLAFRVPEHGTHWRKNLEPYKVSLNTIIVPSILYVEKKIKKVDFCCDIEIIRSSSTANIRSIFQIPWLNFYELHFSSTVTVIIYQSLSFYVPPLLRASM